MQLRVLNFIQIRLLLRSYNVILISKMAAVKLNKICFRFLRTAAIF